MKHVVFTGGGTFGHVGANLALIQALDPTRWTISYIGSKNSIESSLIPKANIRFYRGFSGKLRRYFSLQNMVDIGWVLFGIIHAFFMIRKLNPHIIFSKGGYVAFPVVVAGWLNRVPVIIHESDITLGLTTRLSQRFARLVCLNFESTQKQVPTSVPSLVTGLPVRNHILNGNPDTGRSLTQFSDSVPTLLIFGGSLGSVFLNTLIEQSLDQLVENYQLIHVVGPGNGSTRIHHHRYCQFEYLNDEFAHILAASDMVICRGGASSLTELIALKKPHIVIPLSHRASRGDQIENARYFESLGISSVLAESDATTVTLCQKVHDLHRHQATIVQSMNQFRQSNPTQIICDQLWALAN